MFKKIYEKEVSVYTNNLGEIDERMYVVKKEKQILVIDPNICEKLISSINAWEIENVVVFLTHEHYDHLTGLKWLLDQVDATVWCSYNCRRNLETPIIAVEDYLELFILDKDKDYYKRNGLLSEESYQCDSVEMFKSDFSFVWQDMMIDCLIAPGHSSGGAIYVLADKYVFTGDNLVNGNKVITRLPGGNKREYLQVTKPILESMKEDSIIFPGHGDMAGLRELMQYII